MFIQFDPSNREYIRLLRMLLMLPMMGGFGRTNKYIVAPRSSENDEDIVNNIGDVVKNNVLRLHREAVTNGFEPVRGNDWQRVTCGFYKSTASAEKVKLSVKIGGVDKSIAVRTKALVGLVKGSKVFTDDMETLYNTIDTRTSTGTRDVVVKFTRTIYPVTLSVLAAQVAVSDHLVRYGLSNLGTLDPHSTVLACQISSGSEESKGSRLLDDVDLVYYSGCNNLFMITVDYGEYDSHCTYKNFRKPIIDALKECHQTDIEKLGRYTRYELVEKAYGEGRVHNTLWDIGRGIYRTTQEKIDLYRGSKTWIQNLKRYADMERKIIAPPGVRLVFVSRVVLEVQDGDILACNGVGEDFMTLKSHGSEELTTLLYNSVENLSISDIFLNDDQVSRAINVKVKRVVGDDMLIVGTVKNFDQLKGSGLQQMKEKVFQHVRESGHVVNPQKAFFGFGFAEYRQTHCLRGCIIPKDLIAIISSEKVKNIIDVQSVLISLKATLMTKISRVST